jgi:hypothetical protein
MTADLERFYALLGRLATAPHQATRLAECHGRTPWPERGVYFFFEPGEHRVGRPDAPRVVRVGTHAVSAGSRSTLWGRLRAHRGGGDGRGNHRGSIFRLHVGNALLARDGTTIATWGIGANAPRIVRDSEVEHERRVSAYIGAMHVVWLAVPDEPGPRSDRAVIERNAIALLSRGCAQHDRPSQDWLGRSSPRLEISRSGLWNLNHIDSACDIRFLDVFGQHVDAQVA